MKTTFFEVVRSVNMLSASYCVKLDDKTIHLWVKVLKTKHPELTLYNLDVLMNRMIMGKLPYEFHNGILNISDAYKEIVLEQMKNN